MEKLRLEFVQIGHNCWEDCTPPEAAMKAKPGLRGRSYSPYLKDFFDRRVWRRVLEKMRENGLNAVLIDLADGVKYQSRPEIGLADALSREELREELRFCRELGLEPLPKLNFSSCHDAWLKHYERMLSTTAYYACVADLIAEVCELFNGPRFFHLGMDEEDYANQEYYDFVAIRQNSLWWHDVNFMVAAVEKCGSRPWVWSDKYWNTPPEEFFANMPKSVVQSNWYYEKNFSLNAEENPLAKNIQTMLDLAAAGYDQIPCGRNLNYPETVKFCETRIPERILGYMIAPWGGTTASRETYLVNGAEVAGIGNRLINNTPKEIDS